MDAISDEEAPRGAPQAVDEMLKAMRHAATQSPPPGNGDVDFDITFLRQALENPEMEFLMQTYDKLLENRPERDESLSDASAAVEVLLGTLKAGESAESGDDELVGLLKESNLKSLLGAYDEVIAGKFEIELPPAASLPSFENGEVEGVTKIVGIQKHKDEPLGITLKIEGSQLKIARIIKGGTVDKQGLLHVGDIIWSVNDTEAAKATPMELKAKLAEAKGSIVLRIEPGDIDLESREPSESFVRAHFDFVPKQYSNLPSVDAALPFKHGDVLSILEKNDSTWWQASLVSSSGEKRGLIPAQMFEERRRVSVYTDGESDAPSKSACLPFMKKKEKRRLMYTSTKNHEFDKHELVIYQEVAKIAPGQRKVVVLLGAQGVGRRSLKRRFLASNEHKFATTIPHTSRSMKPGETDGGVYWFSSQAIMEHDVAGHKFIEYGEHEGEIYGTKIDSVRKVTETGRVCILDVSPLALKFLRTPEFKPFIVFVASPGAAKLRELRRACSPDQSGKPPTERELSRTIEESKRLERDYANFFDLKVVNENLDETFTILEDVVKNLDEEPQWVPVSWVYS
eukprot:m.307869 g.307869  ORF g.307869 m.307869 type:complete len:570 (+) comp42953_c0_seq1:97-1806(+)